jgi:dihydrofolate reductase
MRKITACEFMTLDGVIQYVASNTRGTNEWQPTVFINGDVAEKVRELKGQDGPEIYAMGSANLMQTLLKNDLVDALELMILPITLGQGKRLFAGGAIPASFKVTQSQVSPKGIFIVTYERDGEVKTGSHQLEGN